MDNIEKRLHNLENKIGITEVGVPNGNGLIHAVSDIKEILKERFSLLQDYKADLIRISSSVENLTQKVMSLEGKLALYNEKTFNEINNINKRLDDCVTSKKLEGIIKWIVSIAGLITALGVITAKITHLF